MNGIRPGGAQLTERQLAEDFTVSRIPVRAAIRRLVLEGLVERAPRHRTFVHLMSRSDLVETEDVHRALDGFAVREAATRRTDDDLEIFRQDVARARKAVADGDMAELGRAGVDFRSHAYAAARNETLSRIGEITQGRVVRMFRHSPTTDVKPLPTYERVLVAFEKGDPGRATRAMNELSDRIRRARRESLLQEVHNPNERSCPNRVYVPESSTSPEVDRPAEITRALDNVRGRIIRGELLPGDPVTEQTLAAEFGVSRTPMREVIEQLRHEDLLDPPGDGRASRVKAYSMKQIVDFFGVVRTFEVLAARLASQRARRPELDRIERLLRIETAAGNHDAKVTAIFEFRSEMFAMAGSKLLLRINEMLESRLRLHFRTFDVDDLVLRTHRLLHEAISSRETELVDDIIYRMFDLPSVTDAVEGLVNP